MPRARVNRAGALLRSSSSPRGSVHDPVSDATSATAKCPERPCSLCRLDELASWGRPHPVKDRSCWTELTRLNACSIDSRERTQALSTLFALRVCHSITPMDTPRRSPSAGEESSAEVWAWPLASRSASRSVATTALSYSGSTMNWLPRFCTDVGFPSRSRMYAHARNCLGLSVMAYVPCKHKVYGHAIVVTAAETSVCAPRISYAFFPSVAYR
jgi:hypothetical protein